MTPRTIPTILPNPRLLLTRILKIVWKDLLPRLAWLQPGNQERDGMPIPRQVQGPHEWIERRARSPRQCSRRDDPDRPRLLQVGIVRDLGLLVFEDIVQRSSSFDHVDAAVRGLEFEVHGRCAFVLRRRWDGCCGIDCDLIDLGVLVHLFRGVVPHGGREPVVDCGSEPRERELGSLCYDDNDVQNECQKVSRFNSNYQSTNSANLGIVKRRISTIVVVKIPRRRIHHTFGLQHTGSIGTDRMKAFAWFLVLLGTSHAFVVGNRLKMRPPPAVATVVELPQEPVRPSWRRRLPTLPCLESWAIVLVIHKLYEGLKK